MMADDTFQFALDCVKKGIPLPSDIRWTLTMEQRKALAEEQIKWMESVSDEEITDALPYIFKRVTQGR